MAFLSPARSRSLAVCWLLLLALLSGGWNLCAQPATSREYQVKAAFLFNFAQFVEWPATAFTNADEPFQIGVLGEDPFGAALEETVQGEAINGHKIIVLHSRHIADLKDCQMIFVSGSEKGQVKDILSQLNSAAVLTVSDIDNFAANGGIINFFRDGTKVRFAINPLAAQHEGLKLSSQLLSLGKIIQPEKEDRW
jgi:hypothetical protein